MYRPWLDHFGNFVKSIVTSIHISISREDARKVVKKQNKYISNFRCTAIHTSNFTNKVGSGLLNQGFNIAVVFVDTLSMHSKSSQCNTRLGTNWNWTSKN